MKMKGDFYVFINLLDTVDLLDGFIIAQLPAAMAPISGEIVRRKGQSIY